jgi:hypothetical protein
MAGEASTSSGGGGNRTRARCPLSARTHRYLSGLGLAGSLSATNDKVDAGAATEAPAGPRALGKYPTDSRRARAPNATNRAVPGADPDAGPAEPEADHPRHDAAYRSWRRRRWRRRGLWWWRRRGLWWWRRRRRCRDREGARDVGRGIVGLVTRLRSRDRARAGTRQMCSRTADGAVPARSEGDRKTGGRSRADGEVRVAVRLVGERVEGDRLVHKRDHRQAVIPAGRDRGHAGKAAGNVALPEVVVGATPCDDGAVRLQGQAVRVAGGHCDHAGEAARDAALPVV